MRMREYVGLTSDADEVASHQSRHIESQQHVVCNVAAHRNEVQDDGENDRHQHGVDRDVPAWADYGKPVAEGRTTVTRESPCVYVSEVC